MLQDPFPTFAFVKKLALRILFLLWFFIGHFLTVWCAGSRVILLYSVGLLYAGVAVCAVGWGVMCMFALAVFVRGEVCLCNRRVPARGCLQFDERAPLSLYASCSSPSGTRSAREAREGLG